jgi:hypothetical protein
MTAFVMVLVAGMAVRSGTEGTSPEPERPLDMRGEWEGEEWTDGKMCEVRFSNNSMSEGRAGPGLWSRPWKPVDEGAGKARFECYDPDGPAVFTERGMYRWEGDRLTICYRLHGKGRPSVWGDKGQYLLILRRVKPAK